MQLEGIVAFEHGWVEKTNKWKNPLQYNKCVTIWYDSVL